MFGMHGVWFLSHWLILAMCAFQIQAYYEFFNDYPRLVFASFLTVILPLFLALATGSLGSFYYLKALADLFFGMAYWNVTVSYGGPLGLPFDSAHIVTGNPTTAHQWYYWLIDWTNTNLQYRTRDAYGVVTYDGETGFGYMFSVFGLCLVFIGVLRTLWETFSENGAKKEELVSLYKKSV
jgi:hypothetical protein